MAHRFPADVPEKTVREQWQLVVEGRGMLWDNIGEDKRECIRGESEGPSARRIGDVLLWVPH
jgi:hypothetical protein